MKIWQTCCYCCSILKTQIRIGEKKVNAAWLIRIFEASILLNKISSIVLKQKLAKCFNDNDNDNDNDKWNFIWTAPNTVEIAI